MAMTQAAFRFYEDGAQVDSVAIAAQDTNISRTLDSNSNLHLRIRVQETAGVSGFASDDYKLQYSKNGGIYTDVGTGAVIGFVSSLLDEAQATTNRLTGGTGTFVPGESTENGTVTDHQITANNHTEYLYSLTIVSGQVANTDTIDFRLQRNNGALDAYGITPRITVSKAVISDISTITATFAADDTANFDAVTNPNASAVVQNGRLEATGASTGFGYAGRRTKVARSLTNSAVYVQVPQTTNAEAGAETIFRLNLSNSTDANYIGFVKGNTSIIPRYQVAGAQNDQYPAFNATNHAWWRIRHDGTNVLWETAPNNAGAPGTWTVLRTVPLATIGLAINSLYVELLAGQFQGVVGTGTGTAHFDNLNTTSAAPPVTPKANTALMMGI